MGLETRYAWINLHKFLLKADGDLSLGCGNACRLLCCLKPDRMESSQQIWKLNEGLKEITRKLDQIERKAVGRATSFRAGQSGGMPSGGSDKWNDIEEDDQAELDDDRELRQQSQAEMRNRKWKRMCSETWLQDPSLKRAERDFMDPVEESFWLELIGKYFIQ